MRDRVFAKPIKKQFEFDEEVASVFDDMIARSVPFYRENLELIASLVVASVKEGARIFDLGCSTGSLLIEIAKRSDKKLELIGLDNAAPMIERARNKARAFGVDVHFEVADILEYDFKEADIFIANYTMQFIRPLHRERFIAKLHKHLKPAGLFFMSEKIISEDKELDRQLIDIYYAFKKRQGYSEYEIAQKREALENVLVPYTLEENVQMLRECGFFYVEPIFRWANFATFYAKKGRGDSL